MPGANMQVDRGYIFTYANGVVDTGSCERCNEKIGIDTGRAESRKFGQATIFFRHKPYYLDIFL